MDGRGGRGEKYVVETNQRWCSLLRGEGGTATLCTSVLQTLASHMPPDSYHAATKSTAAGAGRRGRRWQAYVGCGQAMKETSHLANLAKLGVGLRRSTKQSPVSSKPDIIPFPALAD